MKSILVAIIVIFFANIASSQTLDKLSPRDSTNCQLFKGANKSERMQYFDKLKHLIILAKTDSLDDPNIQTYTSVETLYTLIGRPNFHQTDLIFGYYLSSLNKTCLVEFELNKLNKIKNFSIKDCN